MPTNPAEIVVLTALWRRTGISRLCLGQVPTSVPGAVFRRIAVGSETADADLADECGWSYVQSDNHPLSDKWNMGAAGAGALYPGADALVVIGSDNLLSARYWERLPVILSAGRRFAYFDHVYYYHVRTGRCVRAIVPYVGAGRMLARSLLDALDWRPWEPGMSRYLDRSMGRRIRQLAPGDVGTWHGFNVRTDPEAIVVDLKSDADQIWTFDERRELDRTYPADGRALLRTHWPDAAVALIDNSDVPAARENGHMFTVNERQRRDWILAVCTGNGFVNKHYACRAHRGDYFWGPPLWIRQLEASGVAERVEEHPDLDFHPVEEAKGKPKPTTTKPEGPATTKPDGPTTTKGQQITFGVFPIEDADPAIKPVRKPAKASDDGLESMQRTELYALAQKLKIRGRSGLSKDELIDAIRAEREE